MARIPGVESVSWSSNLPLWARSVSGLQVEGRQQRSQADQIRTVVNTVDRGYFETAGVAIETRPRRSRMPTRRRRCRWPS